MIHHAMGLPRARRLWPWYAAAWLPLVGFYYFAFSLQGRLEPVPTAFGALVNVLPDAVLGSAVVHACRRLWSGRPRRLSALLVACGIAFTAAATGCKVALNLLLLWYVCGRADWVGYDRGILLWQAFFSLLAFAVLASVTFGISAAARLRAEEERRAQADLLRARTELKALRAQVNPHFLFNTLHSVRALIRENPAAAEEALEQLGDLLRYALRIQDAADDGVLLGEEWEFVCAYLALEKLRLGERLRVEAQVSDAALQAVVPAFVLQPLVENAIRHGIGVRERGGTVRIAARLAHGALHLEVQDDGPRANGLAGKGTGKGLELVRQRLRALYGGAGSVDVTSSPEAGFCVSLRLPGSSEAG